MNEQAMLDREAIRHTMARYTMAGDSLKVADFIAVFTDDAVLESEGVAEHELFCYEGREVIEAWITRWLTPADSADDKMHTATFVRHHLSTCLIEFTGIDTAKAKTYWTAYTDIGPDHCGYYLDNFRKVGEDWLICHRRIRMDWRSPHSLFVAAISRSR